MPSTSETKSPVGEVMPILCAVSFIASGVTSTTSWAKTVLIELAVALRSVMDLPPPPETVQGGHPRHGLIVIVLGAA